MVNILHLSDLHFGAEREETTAIAQRKIALESLIHAIGEQDWQPQILVISGDIAHRGKKQDYIQAEEWIRELCRKLDISCDNIILTPGNHDLDRDETIGMEPPPTPEKAYNWLTIENLRHFKKYFNDYIEFYNKMGIPKYSIGNKSYSLTGMREVLGIRFVSLNSAWFCREDKGKDKGNLWLGSQLLKVMRQKAQLSSLESYNTDPLTIALFHHPKEWLSEVEYYDYDDRYYPSYTYLGRRVHLILNGHVHSKSIVELSQVDHAHILVGGATYAGDTYRNNFSIIQINKEERSFCRRAFEYKSGDEKWVNSDREKKSFVFKGDIHTNILARAVEYTSKLGKKEEPYNFTVSFAKSYSELILPGVKLDERNINDLIPNEAYPRIVLHGGGGTGKSEIFSRLHSQVIEKGYLPLFLNLRGFIDVIGDGDLKNIEDIFSFILPRITKWEFEQTIGKIPLLFMIDAFSEVSSNIRDEIVGYLKRFYMCDKFFILIADRLPPSWDYSDFTHFKVNPLSLDVITEEFTRNEIGSYEKLDGQLKEIYKSPFFLDLAMRTKTLYQECKIRSAIFSTFIENHLSSADADDLARATYESIGQDGKVNHVKFESKLDNNILQNLKTAEVIKNNAFQHHLWIDYLVSRYLAKNPSFWRESAFDAATIYSSAALECLIMTIEQLTVDKRDSFIKAIYDWNLTAAVHSVGEICKSGETNLSKSICSVIIANTAEKLFDGIERTRRKAKEIFNRFGNLPLWGNYTAIKSRNELSEYIKLIDGDSEWFNSWKEIFTDSGTGFNGRINLIEETDSLIGWAATNLARRASLTEEQQGLIRNLWSKYSTVDEKRSIRWRVVHCLGQYGTVENVNLLFEALRNDNYHWVKYGATRALIEISSKEETLRERILTELITTLKEVSFTSANIKRLVINEAIVCTFMRNPSGEWKDQALNFLLKIIELEMDQTEKEIMGKRVEAFLEYDEKA